MEMVFSPEEPEEETEAWGTWEQRGKEEEGVGGVAKESL